MFFFFWLPENLFKNKEDKNNQIHSLSMTLNNTVLHLFLFEYLTNQRIHPVSHYQIRIILNGSDFFFNDYIGSAK